MPINKIVDSFDEAVADIEDGATIMIGGFGIVAGAPSLLLEALGRKGSKDLTMISNVTGFGKAVWSQLGFKFAEDPDILVRNGQVKKAIATAPREAVEGGRGGAGDGVSGDTGGTDQDGQGWDRWHVCISGSRNGGGGGEGDKDY